jgi:hypothetical protein
MPLSYLKYVLHALPTIIYMYKFHLLWRILEHKREEIKGD